MSEVSNTSVGSPPEGGTPSPSEGQVLRPEATTVVSPAECYTIRNGWAWAHIFVRHGVGKMHDASARHWVHVSVISDYGVFGYCWTHIGADWRAFLAGLDMHYAMQKMLGERFRVPLSINEAEEKGRKSILQYRREDSLDAGDARKLWDGLNDADRDGSLDAFLLEWDRCSEGRWYAHDWWDMGWDKVNPQAEGFWREIWPHFCAALRASEDVTQHSANDGEASKAAKPLRATEPNTLHTQDQAS